MKNVLLRKLLPLVMLAAMLLTAVPAAAAFRDTAGHWAEKTLDEWQDKGFIAGRGDGSFQPDGTMTRAELAKLVNRTMGFTAESAISFSDVTERDWFYAEVARAVAAGYAQGSGGAFYPNQPVTRAEAAAMLARAAGLAANEERASAFTDAASIPAWARGSVGAVAASGYMNGYPDGAFGASDPMTRAEAVVTLDRVLKSAKETVIEAAGTTLENETITGDLIIAESVGEGTVTLKNVTVLGSVIVKGGGANSIYFDNVRVNGAVRMQKEGVRLRLTGSTALERVEIALPCRITQDSAFEGALGALVIDLIRESAKEIQIEAPAERVELVSRASVSLGADVGELLVGKDAEDARLEVKRGASVGDLTVDARIKLTGDGAVISLVVSVSGVTVSGTLTVEKTGTTDGAEAPATSGGSSGSSSSGGSSGGSSTPVKRVTGAEPVADVTVPYNTSEADAMSRLPATVTLNVTENGTAGTVSAAVSWALDKAYDADPRMDTVYTATGTVTIPDGYTYDGTLTVTASLTVTADPEKVVVSISEVAGLELPYGSTEGDAQLPVKVTVETKDGDEWLAEVRWTLDGAWASPGVNTYKGTVIMPAFCYYNGEMDADITTTVTVAADGVTPKAKAVVDHVPLRLTSIGFARTVELVLAAARPSLPTNVTLKCEDGSYIAVTISANDWYFTFTTYNPSPSTNQTLSLTESAALPAGYAYAGGTSPVYCSVEVKKLDTAALESALSDANALLYTTLTASEDAAFADNSKIYTAADGTSADSVTNGVRFVEQGRVDALNSAYSAARNKQSSDTFASQAECDSLTKDLKDKTDALKAAVRTGTNTNTALYVKLLVEDMLSADRNPDAPYHSVKQPLKAGSFYSLFNFTGVSLPGSNMVLSSISWSAKGDGASLVDVGLGVGSNQDAYGAKITSAPAEPKSVTFVATAVCTHRTDPNKTFTFTLEYTATIGAPIQVNASAPVTAPKLTSSNIVANDISLRVPLTGAEYITGINASKITVEGYADPSSASGIAAITITVAPITEGKSCTADSRGLFVPVTAACGTMPLKPVQTNSDGTPKLNYAIGKIRVTIQKEALTVNEASGWYAPDGDLTYYAEAWGCYPTVTVAIHGASNKDTAYRNVSVQIEYAYREFFGAVAFATENSAEGAAAAGRRVRFNDVDWKDGSGQNLITCTMENVRLDFDLNTTYYIWWNFNGNDESDALTSSDGWTDANITILPSSETP